jgi:type II secretory pathway pseudopilin PulG
MHYRLRVAFTMVELVFAIMILGIVASISSEIILQVYSAYLQQRTVHNASLKTELAISQLANRLTYRINRSVIARKSGNLGNTFASDIYPLREVPTAASNTHTILEWIGYDNDTFSTSNTPAWSGYCNVDVGASSFATLSTPGSYGDTDGALSKILAYYGAGNGAIAFAGHEDYRTDGGGAYGGTYSAICMFDTAGKGCMFPVSNLGSDTATFTGASDRQGGRMIYTEFYRYAVSAFAVVPTNKHKINNVDVWDLHLRYGYQPWEGENYTSNANNDSILLRNVSVFRFIKETNNIRIKLCVVEQVGNGTSEHFSVCKEKAVIR